MVLKINLEEFYTEKLKCTICIEPLESNCILFDCNHLFHTACYNDQNNDFCSCVVCRKPIAPDKIKYAEAVAEKISNDEIKYKFILLTEPKEKLNQRKLIQINESIADNLLREQQHGHREQQEQRERELRLYQQTIALSSG